MAKTIDNFFTPRQKKRKERSSITPEEDLHGGMDQDATGQQTRGQLLDDIGKLLDKKLANLVTKQDIALLTKQIEELKEENEALKIEVVKLKDREVRIASKLIDLESRARRNNLIFRGIHVTEQTKDYKRLVAKFCEEKLNMGKNVWVNRAHPLDYDKGAIIAHFPEDSAIEYIMSQTQNLKGTNFYIHRDFPQEIRVKRARLAAVRSEVKRVAGWRRMPLVYDHVYINNIRFSWEDDKLMAGKDDGAEKLRAMFKHDFREALEKIKNDDGKQRDRRQTYAEAAGGKVTYNENQSNTAKHTTTSPRDQELEEGELSSG